MHAFFSKFKKTKIKIKIEVGENERKCQNTLLLVGLEGDNNRQNVVIDWSI